jgi:hypothetical protein
MLSMPPALAHTAKNKTIKRSSVEGMSKRSSFAQRRAERSRLAAKGGLLTCSSESFSLEAGDPTYHAVQSLWDDAGNFSEPDSEDEEMEVA